METGNESRNRRVLQKEVARIAEAMSFISAEDRLTWIVVGGALCSHFGEDGFAIWCEWSGTSAKYRKDEAHATWRTFEPGRVGIGALVRKAQAGGWQFVPPTRFTRRSSARTLRPADVDARAAEAIRKVQRCLVSAPDTHPYLHRKHIIGAGLQMAVLNDYTPLIAGHYVDGWIAVPVREQGLIRTYQFISPRPGKPKLMLPGLSLGDGYYVANAARSGNPVAHVSDAVWLCEGLATAETLGALAAGRAIVTFGSERMLRVAKAIRAEEPEALLVFVADVGNEARCEELAAQFGCGWIGLPPLPPLLLPDGWPLNSDFEDFARICGSAALSALLRPIALAI